MAKRKPGEKFCEYYIRLNGLAVKIEKEQPTYSVFVKRDVTKALLRALPMAFETGMTDDDLDQPKKVYQRARNYIKCNPQCKLRDEDVQREGRQVVNAIEPSPQPPRPRRQFKHPRSHHHIGSGPRITKHRGVTIAIK